MEYCNFTDKANLNTTKVEKCTRQKTFLAAMLRKRSDLGRNISSQSRGLECSYVKIFISGFEILVTGPARPASQMSIWKFYKEKSGEARSRKPRLSAEESVVPL